jgi:Ca2+-binding RTX toxin-like protein
VRRVVLLLVVVAAVLAMTGGVALALDKGCTGGDCLGTRDADTLTGSTNIDRIAAMEGNDAIDGGAGSDQIFGDEGNDTIVDDGSADDFDSIFGDEGNDTLNVQEGDVFEDNVDCGPGKKDKVFFDDGIDIIARNCEIKKTDESVGG